MTESRVFEVLKVDQEDNTWIIGGLVFDTISLGDVLFTTEQPESRDVKLHIVDIVTYGHHLDALDRGDTGYLKLECDTEVDFSKIKYLYRH